jgi:peptide/nickel transport system substrate-binding protein
LILLLAGCGPGGAATGGQPGEARSGAPKSVTIGITSAVEAFANMGGTTTVGGWISTSEIHSNALVTSDRQTRRPVARLAEKLPSLDDGTITILADGRMRVVYALRRDVVWQDGAPFTARDMVFTLRINGDRGCRTRKPRW